MHLTINVWMLGRGGMGMGRGMGMGMGMGRGIMLGLPYTSYFLARIIRHNVTHPQIFNIY